MSKRADEMVGKARWRATRDGEIVNDDQTIDDVLEMIQRGCLVLNTKLTPRRKAIAHILSKAFSESDDDDAFFFAQTFFMNLVDRFGLAGARAMFAFLASPTYAKENRRNILVSLFEASGLSKAEFARKLAKFKHTPTGDASELGARRYLDRMLREVARERRKGVSRTICEKGVLGQHFCILLNWQQAKQPACLPRHIAEPCRGRQILFRTPPANRAGLGSCSQRA